MSRARRRFYDTTGRRYGGIPTWPWRCAPAHLLTRRQLAAHGLRPAGRAAQGQVLWHGRRREVRVAHLYDVALAKRKRHPATGQRAVLDNAPTALRTCPTCASDVRYCIPRSLGQCADCHDDAMAQIRGMAA